MARVQLRQRDSVQVDRLFLGHSVFGKTIYVDSVNGNDNNTGEDPKAALATLAQAIANATASAGDIIVLAPKHAETLVSAGAINVSKAGLTIVGLGRGAERATFTLGTAATATFQVSAADITIKNVLFTLTIDSLAKLLDVDSTDLTLEDCEFRSDEGATKAQALVFVELDGGAANAVDRATIRRCKFTSLTAGANSAIKLAEVADEVTIEDCEIDGDWADAGIHNPTAKILTSLRLSHNVVRNRQTGDHAIELVSACTGRAVGNHLFGDTLGTIFDPGSLLCVDNWEQDAIDEAGVVSPRTMNPAGLADGAIAAATLASNAIAAAKIAGDAITNAKIADNAFSQEQFDVDSTAGFLLGKEATRAAANLPATTAAPIFTVSGGRILLLSIVGEVTTIIQAQLCNQKLTANPTVGADVDLCAVVDINGDAVGTMYNITGTLANAMVATPSGAMPTQAAAVVVAAGTIDLSESATNTGQIKWTLHYVPLDAGATVVAA